jgi:hypothetical protein
MQCMAQAVSHRPPVRVGPCGICGRQSGNGTGFFSGFLGFNCRYHSTVASNTHRPISSE